MRKTAVLLIFLGFIACKSRFERAELFHENGTPKVVGVYHLDEDTVRVGEKHFYPDSNLRMIAYYDDSGKRKDKWTYFYENGELWSSCEYSGGLKHGESIVYYPNGQVRYSGKYEMDRPVSGSFKYYNEKGALIRTE